MRVGSLFSTLRHNPSLAEMRNVEIYQFILSLIVFLLLTVSFTTLVVLLVRLNTRLVRAGLNDDLIKIEYEKEQAKAKSILSKVLDRFVLVVCCGILFVTFGFSLSVSLNEGKVTGAIPSMSVVRSGSMSYVNEKNQYLSKDEIAEHIQMFDLVFIHQLPAEADLNVNDIVVYESDGAFIIHRIVEIFEPSESHSERLFLLHGDANEIADKFPVRYRQMKGIYSGKRIPFIGSFILFMQSPAGWLCILLVIFTMIALPVAEKKYHKERSIRLQVMGLIPQELPEGEQKSAVVIATLDDPLPSLSTFEEEPEENCDEESLEGETREMPFEEELTSKNPSSSLEEPFEEEQPVLEEPSKEVLSGEIRKEDGGEQ